MVMKIDITYKLHLCTAEIRIVKPEKITVH